VQSAGALDDLAEMRIASSKNGSSNFLVKVTSKMKLSPSIKLDVVIDQPGFPDDSPKSWKNPRDAQRDDSKLAINKWKSLLEADTSSWPS
jgi:hypothetical protein